MKKTLLFLIISFQIVAFAFAQTRGWHTAKSAHFIVYYKNAPAKFIDTLISKAEDYYSDIADNLGFKRYQYWLWENRAKIYIHDDAQEYQAATGGPAWSYGHATPKDKVIHSFPTEKMFFDTILPHELGHIIFREFVGFNNETIPLWLDEGVACYQEELKRPSAKRIVKEAIKNGNFINLEDLSRFKIRAKEDNETVKIFYAEAISIVAYLIKEFGEDRFVFFCRKLRDQGNFEDSLLSAYRFKSIRALDIGWQEYIMKD